MTAHPYRNSNNEWVIPAEPPSAIHYQPPGNILSVSDVERLAKAGVAIKFEDIRHQVTADVMMAPAMNYDERPRSLEDSFWDRWKRAHTRQMREHIGVITPYGIHATEYDGKIYVTVSPQDQAPFILEDEAVLYPSDALMAKLALLEKITP